MKYPFHTVGGVREMRKKKANGVCRKSIKLPLMEILCVMFCSICTQKTVKSNVSHITHSLSMVLTLDLFWKLINLLHLTRQPTVIELTSTMISGSRIYTDIPIPISTGPLPSAYNLSFVHSLIHSIVLFHSLHMLLLWFGSVGRFSPESILNGRVEQKTNFRLKTVGQIGVDRLLFGRLNEYAPLYQRDLITCVECCTETDCTCSTHSLSLSLLLSLAGLMLKIVLSAP